jgi:hypothetical protein
MSTWSARGTKIAVVLLSVMFLLALLVLIGANPWLAILLPAVALIFGVLGIIGRLRRKRPRTRALAVTSGIGLGILLIFALIYVGLYVNQSNEPGAVAPRLDFELTGDYRGVLTCAVDDCGTWVSTEAVDVQMPAELYSAHGDSLVTALAQTGWRRVTATSPAEDTVRLRLERSARQRTSATRLWPLRTTQMLTLPDWPTVELPRGSDTTELLTSLGLPRSRAAGTVAMVFRLTTESAVTLRYPRNAVLATTPAGSAASDISGGRQERVIRVFDVFGEEISADVLTPFMRSEPAARFVSLGATGWGWLIAIGIVGIVVAPYIRSKGEAVIPDLLRRMRSKSAGP